MATTFLQLSQDHLKQPGMKLFPNYTPPIPPHHNNSNSSSSATTATTTASGNFSTMSNNVNNHHYHQITYQTQTLAPLRLNQDHFSSSKTNTLGGVVGPNGLPNGRPKYQTHHHHHHHHHDGLHHEQQQHQHPPHHPLSSDHELDVDGCSRSASISAASGCDNEDDSNSATTSPPHSPTSPTPPELPIRNGLLPGNYNVNTLNHNIIVGNGKMATGTATAATSNTGERKTMRHYH